MSGCGVTGLRDQLSKVQGYSHNICIPFCSVAYKGRYTRRVLLPEHAPGSICRSSTHEGAYCGSLLHIIVHTGEQTKETCFEIADIHQTRAWKLVQKFSIHCSIGSNTFFVTALFP